MATYENGVTDYQSQIQPTEPNLAFDAQILQTKQSKYDTNHKKVSDLYGSLLNADMSRGDNIAARDQFFKTVNGDIRQMAGMDFSLDASVEAASNVFESIYNDKNIVKDMVFTKHFKTQQERSSSFKSCIDPEKCGGQWWEEGDKAMAYKMHEFQNASSAEAMGFENVDYVPYNNVMKEAQKIFKTSDLNITTDEINGGYKITTKNGQQLISPLTKLFNETIGKDPKYTNQYKTKAYVGRKDWVMGKVNSGEYANEDDAHVGYFQERNEAVQAKLRQNADDLNVDLGHLDEKMSVLKETIIKKNLGENSDEYQQYKELAGLHDSANNAKSYVAQMEAAMLNKSNSQVMRAIGDQTDEAQGFAFFHDDIETSANVLAYKDYSVAREADEYAVLAKKFKYDSALKAQEHANNVTMEGIKTSNKIKVENWKLQNGVSTDGSGKNDFGETTAYQNKLNEAKTIDIDLLLRTEMSKNMTEREKDLQGNVIPLSKEEYANMTKNTPENRENIRLADRLRPAAEAKQLKLKKEANVLALKAGELPPFRLAMSYTDLNTSTLSNKNVGGKSYTVAWVENRAHELGVSKEEIVKAMSAKEIDRNMPLYPQLEGIINSTKK